MQPDEIFDLRLKIMTETVNKVIREFVRTQNQSPNKTIMELAEKLCDAKVEIYKSRRKCPYCLLTDWIKRKIS